MKHNHIHYSTSFKHVKKATQGVFSSPCYTKIISLPAAYVNLCQIYSLPQKVVVKQCLGFFLFHFVLFFFFAFGVQKSPAISLIQ